MKAIKLVILVVLFLSSIYLIKDAVIASTVVSDIPLESSPRRVAVNPSTDQAFILSESPASLLIVDLKTEAILSTIALSKKPAGLALAPGA